MIRLSASTENGRSSGNDCVIGSTLKDSCHRVSMTNMELARAADSSFALLRLKDSVDVPSNPLEDERTKKGGVRFNIRKRAVSDDEPKVVMESYNSAFLSGLFADIASASQNEESHPRLNERVSIKKSRVSMTRSLSRHHQSYHNLADVAAPDVAPTAEKFFDHPVMTVQADDASTEQQPVEHTISRENSLSYQLHCVSSSSSNECDNKPSTTDFCKLAFPHLPATVSDQDLTQMMPSRQSSETPKETYGWFVEMDAEAVSAVTDAYQTSKDDLAFSAPTAPKANDHEAQVEWAQAADTIDDVLGDFF